jgi:hypothetical protein
LGKPEAKRPLETPRRRWEDNIKMGSREIGWGGMNWIEVPQDRDRWEDFCYHGNEPWGSIKCSELLE